MDRCFERTLITVYEQVGFLLVSAGLELFVVLAERSQSIFKSPMSVTSSCSRLRKKRGTSLTPKTPVLTT